MAIYRTVVMQTISPQSLSDRIKHGEPVHLLDVRTPAEHAAVHVPGVYLMPLDRLSGEKLSSVNGFTKEQPVYVLCRSGARARQAAEQLAKEGFSRCVVVDGGTQAWADAGLPVNRGDSNVISLERQVRIAAGILVLTGVILGALLHPVFYGLSAFVGAGLVFAGVTDWCGMGMMLARMPWNQRSASAQ
jgi:rhodanese-related sulfurtransferase